MNLWVIGFFVVFTAFVAIITFFKTKEKNLDTGEGYFLGGRSLKGSVIAGSLLLTNLSAVSFIGMSTQAYENNMSPMGWEVGSAIALVVVALFLVPRYLKQGITTIPDFIQARFDGATRNFITILFLISYAVNLLPITLYSGAVAMGQIFNISGIFGITDAQSIWLMVWVIGIIGAIYAVFGGLRAVAISDSINGIALVIGGLLVPIFALIYMGDGNISAGFTEFLNATPEKLNAVGSGTDALPFGTMFTGLILVNLYYWGTDQSIIQRALGAESLKEGQKGVIIAGALKVFTPVILIVPGILAFQIFGGNVENTDNIYPMLVNEVLPDPILGLFAAAMLGAILSTFNSVLNSSLTLFAVNVYRPIFAKQASDEKVIRVGKIYGIIMAVMSMVIAPFIMYAPNGLFDYLQIINGFFNVPIFTIIFIGYVTKRVPPIASKIGVSFFVLVYALTQLGVINTGLHYLHISAILFVVTCAIMLIIGKFRPMEKPFELQNNQLVDIKPWKHRYKASGILIFLMVSMYIVFSSAGLASAEGITVITVVAIAAVAAACTAAVAFIEKKFGTD